ncbi:aromatic-ring hydroxylase C-terminal domain-containing protein, partial [Streptomyces sp. Wh19]
AEADGAVLVRPDGHVAWVAPGSSRTALAMTLRRILSAG